MQQDLAVARHQVPEFGQALSCRHKPGTADRERERARQYLQAVSGGRRIPRLERADGDDVLVERAETVTAGWHDENSRKYRAVSR